MGLFQKRCPMPRYYFDPIDGHRERDSDGVELHGEHAAQVAAIRFAGEVLALEPTKLAEHGQWRVEVKMKRESCSSRL